MKLSLIFIFLLNFATSSFSQIKAITDNGEEVILYNDKTWAYASNESINTNKIDTNIIEFFKPAKSTFLVKSSKLGYGIFIDPKKWSFKKSKPDEATELSFTLKDSDAYGMVVTEKIEMPLETLREAALANAKNVSADVKIVKEEYRKVNNNIVLLLQMDGSIKGIDFTYLGYYFSSQKGTIQLITYTSRSLLKGYRTELLNLLNGFVTTE